MYICSDPTLRPRWVTGSLADAIRAVLTQQQPPSFNKLNKNLNLHLVLDPGVISSLLNPRYDLKSCISREWERARQVLWGGRCVQMSAKTNNLSSHGALIWTQPHIKNQLAQGRGEPARCSRTALAAAVKGPRCYSSRAARQLKHHHSFI